jgi:hypothetical protein
MYSFIVEEAWAELGHWQHVCCSMVAKSRVDRMQLIMFVSTGLPELWRAGSKKTAYMLSLVVYRISLQMYVDPDMRLRL